MHGTYGTLYIMHDERYCIVQILEISCRQCETLSKTHTHTTVLLLVWNMSGSTRVSGYQKGKTKKVKTNLDLLEQEIVRGSGICWAIRKSALHADNHANIPPLSFFTGRMPFLTPNQQRQSTEGEKKSKLIELMSQVR